MGPEVSPKMGKRCVSKDKSHLCRVHFCQRATELVVLLPIIYDLCVLRVVLNTIGFTIMECGSCRILEASLHFIYMSVINGPFSAPVHGDCESHSPSNLPQVRRERFPKIYCPELS